MKSPPYYAPVSDKQSLLSRGAWIEIFDTSLQNETTRSLLSRGAWIEIIAGSGDITNRVGRSSHEERGLKYKLSSNRTKPWMSLLSRGAWIEMRVLFKSDAMRCRRSSHEERGLKLPENDTETCSQRRSSHEERGLKYMRFQRSR